MPKNRLELVLLLLALVGSIARADTSGSISDSSGPGSTFGFSATDHLIVSSRQDSYDLSRPPQNLIMHEDLLRGDYDPYSLNLQFNNQVPFSSGLQAENHPFLFEKATATIETNTWDIKMGDSHQEIGKGIALSLYRDDVFGIDNTLQGGYARYHPKGMEVSVFGGRINAVQAPVAINAVDDPLLTRNVWIAGTTAAVDVNREGKVGAQYFLALEQNFLTSSIDQRWHTFGLTYSQNDLFPGVDLYVESNLLVNQQIFGGQVFPLPTGEGSYLSLTWTEDVWKFKMEAKDYRADDFDFRRPPTLEDDVVETTNTTDVSASRLVVERKLPGGKSTVGASTLVGYDNLENSVFYHAILDYRFKGDGSSRFELEAKGGYRWMPSHENLLHGRLTVKFRTAKSQSLELSAEKRQEHLKLNVIPSTDDRNIFGATYNWNERLSTGLGYEYVPSNTPDLGYNFFNANGTFKMGELTAKAFLGETSGGLVCSGGVCRQIPPYTGALVETIYVF